MFCCFVFISLLCKFTIDIAEAGAANMHEARCKALSRETLQD